MYLCDVAMYIVRHAYNTYTFSLELCTCGVVMCMLSIMVIIHVQGYVELYTCGV